MAKKKVDKKQKAPPPVADINVTPMVDVMLVLLIIFMVITPMLSKGVSVDLAKTRNPIPMQAADKSDAIVCAVTRDGKTYLNTTQMLPEDLPNKVKDLLSSRLDKEVSSRPTPVRDTKRLWRWWTICAPREWIALAFSPSRFRIKTGPQARRLPPVRQANRFYKGAILWEWQSADPVAVRNLIST